VCTLRVHDVHAKGTAWHLGNERSTDLLMRVCLFLAQRDSTLLEGSRVSIGT